MEDKSEPLFLSLLRVYLPPRYIWALVYVVVLTSLFGPDKVASWIEAVGQNLVEWLIR